MSKGPGTPREQENNLVEWHKLDRCLNTISDAIQRAEDRAYFDGTDEQERVEVLEARFVAVEKKMTEWAIETLGD